MFFTFLVFLSAFLLEGIGTYVSVVGLGTLFAYSMVAMIMAAALDVAKVVNVTFLYRHWKEIGWTMKSYMLAATLVLMMITSTGVFGYLSGEFQKAIASNSQQTVVIQALTEEQGRLQKRKEEIDKQIAQLPQNNVRGRRQLMQQFGPEVGRINDRLSEIDKKLPELKVANIEKDTHVGPILYVAEAFKTTPVEAVKWVILTIIFVFDPLAIALLIAGNFLLMRKKPEEEFNKALDQFTASGGAKLDEMLEKFDPENHGEAWPDAPSADDPKWDDDEAGFWTGANGPQADHDGAMAAIMATPHLREHLEKNPPPWAIGVPKPLTGQEATDAVREAGVIDADGNLTENFAPTLADRAKDFRVEPKKKPGLRKDDKPKRKYVRKQKAEPVREKVVIKAPPPPKPKPPKVKVVSEGDKEVIKIEKQLMPTSLDNIRGTADFSTENTTTSNVKKTYESN